MALRTQEVTLPNGSKAVAHEVEVQSTQERWNEYTLADGTVFKAKLSVIDVMKVDGEVDPQGNPILVVNATTTIAVVSAPKA